MKGNGSLSSDLLRGERVRLAVEDPQTMAEAFSRWSRDSEYSRLEGPKSCQPRSVKAIKEWLENEREKAVPGSYQFTIRTLEEERLIGEIGLDGVLWSHGACYVGIGIGERDWWGKGYGTDAMNIILRFAFMELNLQRVSLNVFDYNLRAIRSYEKVGFIHEGRERGALQKDGSRYDILYMGILRGEWQQKLKTRK